MPRDNPPHPESDQNQQFEAAQQIHCQIKMEPQEYPEGWVEQVRFREQHGLPPFRPAQFLDDVRVWDVVTGLEDELDISINFVSMGDTRTWDVHIDNTVTFHVNRSRNDAANTIVELTADEFIRKVYEEYE